MGKIFLNIAGLEEFIGTLVLSMLSSRLSIKDTGRGIEYITDYISLRFREEILAIDTHFGSIHNMDKFFFSMSLIREGKGTKY
jgi:hypothetical protein